jgi:hypothetical protein
MLSVQTLSSSWTPGTWVTDDAIRRDACAIGPRNASASGATSSSPSGPRTSRPWFPITHMLPTETIRLASAAARPDTSAM